MDSLHLEKRLKQLYPDSYEWLYREVSEKLIEFTVKHPNLHKHNLSFSEKDSVLICYADHVSDPERKTLPIMNRFFSNYVKDYFSKIHFLPFYPYSSDDGFSVIDYNKINPSFGSWKDVEEISKDYELMFDAVINHISQKSKWFKEFLKGNPDYSDYFITFEKDVDVSSVFRPRTHKLLTKFKLDNKETEKYVWTTFSDDQIDLNYASSKLYLEIVDLLLFYIEKGATAIRLDAIAFIWKKLETSCIHLPEAHEVVKSLRDIIKLVSPNVWIITETNVPHEDNISYFGDGHNEAHMVYNFTLPPLLLYSFMKQNSNILTKWASSLEYLSNETTYFNFTASHDGIGVTPLKGIVDDSDIIELAKDVESKGGKVNYRTVPGKEPVPYELNIVYLNAMGGIRPFLASQFIQLSLRGIPGVYLNSFIGAENDYDGLKYKGYNRAINREKFDFSKLCSELDDKNSSKNNVYSVYSSLLEIRKTEELFSPLAEQKILDISDDCFSIVRHKEGKRLLAIVNITNHNIKINKSQIQSALMSKEYDDLISGEIRELDSDIILNPYDFKWLRAI